MTQTILRIMECQICKKQQLVNHDFISWYCCNHRMIEVNKNEIRKRIY